MNLLCASTGSARYEILMKEFSAERRKSKNPGNPIKNEIHREVSYK